MFWLYKCNSRRRPWAAAYGDWDDFFKENLINSWGSTEWTSQITKLNKNDAIIASDRNELVGLARVVEFQSRSGYQDVILEPLEQIGARVRPLKHKDPRIARIAALKRGNIRTIYPISDDDAKRLIRAASKDLQPDIQGSYNQAEAALKGAGFGTAEQNAEVERAATDFVKSDFVRRGWKVKDVSRENRGYDLLCEKRGQKLHLVVKGVSGTAHKFIITANEKNCWSEDKRFVLALVTNALTTNQKLALYRGPKDAERFSFSPISYASSLFAECAVRASARGKSVACTIVDSCFCSH
jgi:hypothetical protein